MSGKLCSPWSDGAFCGVWSGSTLFARAWIYEYVVWSYRPLGICHCVHLTWTQRRIRPASSDVCEQRRLRSVCAPRSLITIFAILLNKHRIIYIYAYRERPMKTDQTPRMWRLIWVFARIFFFLSRWHSDTVPDFVTGSALAEQYRNRLTCGSADVTAQVLPYFKKLKKTTTKNGSFYYIPASIPLKSISDRYRPDRIPVGPVTFRYRFK